MAQVKLRFVTTGSMLSAAIRFAEDFSFSHVEAVMPDGTLLGAHAGGGVLARPADYDKNEWTKQSFWSYAVDDGAAAKWESYLRERIGRPYDYQAILGFVMRNSLHDKMHIICSALQTMALRTYGASVFPFPLIVPAHETSPRDLAMMCNVLAPLSPVEERVI